MSCVICYNSWLSVSEDSTAEIPEPFFSSPVALSCGHIFHNSCILKWLSLKDCCPTCRQPQKEQLPLKLFLDNSIATSNTIKPPTTSTDSIALLLAEGYTEKLSEKESKLAQLRAENDQLKLENAVLLEKDALYNEKKLKLKKSIKELSMDKYRLNTLIKKLLVDNKVQAEGVIKLNNTIAELNEKVKQLSFYKQSLSEARKMIKSLSIKLAKASKQAFHYQIKSVTSQQNSSLSQIKSTSLHRVDTDTDLQRDPDNNRNLSLNSNSASASEPPNILYRGSLKPCIFKPADNSILSNNSNTINNLSRKVVLNPFAIDKISHNINSQSSFASDIKMEASITNRKHILYTLPTQNPQNPYKRQTKLQFTGK
ncbi:hypothetical protein BB561_002215 [Smittium simulii]|uniref:RING-type domain-containing protein n=1 Tax=Smittium simulii TaxID=133385 RepID=A0A2T9YRC1_9FUNG|nr:hypothetical protein BB561_002215 [Smittium simulii]